MKTFVVILISVVVAVVMQSFSLNVENFVKDYVLEDGEVLEYSGTPVKNSNSFEASYSSSGFDRSRYSITIDNTGHIEVAKRRGSLGKHQSELNLKHTNGTIARKGDTMVIHASTEYDKLYIVPIEKQGKIDSFSSELDLVLVSVTMENESCQNRISTNHFGAEIVALPYGVSRDALYKPFHSRNTIGRFTYFYLKDSKDKFETYAQGDYIIIGGNSLSAER